MLKFSCRYASDKNWSVNIMYLICRAIAVYQVDPGLHPTLGHTNVPLYNKKLFLPV